MAKRVNVMLKDLTSEPDLFVLEFAVNDVSELNSIDNNLLKCVRKRADPSTFLCSEIYHTTTTTTTTIHP